MNEKGELQFEQREAVQEVDIETSPLQVPPATSENITTLQNQIFDLKDEIEQEMKVLENVSHQKEYYGGIIIPSHNGNKVTPGFIMSQKRQLEHMNTTYQQMVKKEQGGRVEDTKGFMKKAAMIVGFIGSMFAAKEATKKETAETQVQARTEIAAK